MQSDLSTPNSQITGITKANPGVVTIGAGGLVPFNGDYVVMTIEQGMFQIDGRVFRAANVAGQTFALEGEDTTNYDTFVSGFANKITYGFSLATATGLTAAGGDFDFLDATTIHDTNRKQIPGLPSAASYTFENLWIPADAALKGMKQASDNQAQRAFRFLFAGGQKVVFNGYVGATLLPVGNAQDIVKTNSVITMFGKPTIYQV
jgi:hypothetical protein